MKEAKKASQCHLWFVTLSKTMSCLLDPQVWRHVYKSFFGGWEFIKALLGCMYCGMCLELFLFKEIFKSQPWSFPTSHNLEMRRTGQHLRTSGLPSRKPRLTFSCWLIWFNLFDSCLDTLHWYHESVPSQSHVKNSQCPKQTTGQQLSSFDFMRMRKLLVWPVEMLEVLISPLRTKAS